MGEETNKFDFLKSQLKYYKIVVAYIGNFSNVR